MSPRHPHHKQSTTFAKRRRNRIILICGLVVLNLVVWSFSSVSFFSLNALNIDNVQVSGVDPSLVPVLQAAVLDSIQGNYLGLFSRSNTLIYSRSHVLDAVKRTTPDVSSVEIYRIGGETIGIDIKEKDAAAIACMGYPDFSGGNLGIDADEDCYFADSTGLIYKKATSTTGDIYPRYYVPTLNTNAGSTMDALGSYATSTPEFMQLQKMYFESQKYGMKVDAISIKDAGEYEMYIESPELSIDAESSVTVVYFNNQRPLLDELANLVSFWSTMRSKSKLRTATTTFDYIDVRYGANVFYK